MLLLHPGDLGFSGLLSILVLLLVLFGVPIFFVILIIYKIATRRRDEFPSVTTNKE